MTSPVTTGAIAASHAIAAAASPSSHAPSDAPVSDAGRAAGGPPGPDLLGPLLLQGGVAVEQEQVGQGDVRPGLDRLPGPLRQQPGRGQPPHASACFCVMLDSWMASRQTGRKPSSERALRPLSETYDAAESVPTQIERGAGDARRRGWIVAATFKDDGFSGFKEMTRDGFGELIAAIEAGRVDAVIVRDIDRLTRNLTDWNAFEKACVRHGVRLGAYTGGDLDLYRRGCVLRRDGDAAGAAGKRGRERPGPRGPGPGGAQGPRTGGGQRWFGYTRIYANPDEPNHKKRHIVREDINPVEAEAIRDAATRVLDHGESVASIARDWTARGIRPVAAGQWWPTSIVGMLTSPRLAGLREWQGQKYRATQRPAIIDTDTDERLVRLFADPARRMHWCAPRRICCPVSRPVPSAVGGCITGGTLRSGPILRVREGPGRVRRDGDQGGTAGGVRDRRGAGRAGILAVQEVLRAGEDQDAPRRAELLAQIRDAQGRWDEARRDDSGRVIDWYRLARYPAAHRRRINTARRKYDRPTGSATVMSQHPPSERVRDAWESWSTDRRDAAIRAVTCTAF